MQDNNTAAKHLIEAADWVAETISKGIPLGVIKARVEAVQARRTVQNFSIPMYNGMVNLPTVMLEPGQWVEVRQRPDDPRFVVMNIYECETNMP